MLISFNALSVASASSSPLLNMLIDQDAGKQLQLQLQIPMIGYDFGCSVVDFDQSMTFHIKVIQECQELCSMSCWQDKKPA